MKNRKIFEKAVLILLNFMIILPLFVILIWSFTNRYDFADIFPSSFSLRGWRYVFENHKRIFSSLGTSFVISFFTTFISVLISIPCAASLAFFDFRFKKFVNYLVFSPVIVPTVAISMGLNMQFMRMGISRTYFGVILVSIVPCLPYSVNIIKEMFLLVGNDYFRVAKTLGASDFYIIKNITLPVIMPGIVTASVMCFIVSFSEYFMVYLIGGGRIISFTMEMFPFVKSGERIMGSVFSVIFVIFASVLLFAMQSVLKNIYRDYGDIEVKL